MTFSVIIPAAFAEQTLRQAAESALVSPLLTELLIVVDAGAETLAVAQALAAKDRRVQVLQTGAASDLAEATSGTAGPGAARNLGLAQASGEWVCFLDADDLYSPGYLEALASFTEQNADLDVVHTRLVRVVDGQEVDNHPLRFRFEQGSRAVSLADEPHMIGLSVAAAAFRREALERVEARFNEALPWSEDADFIVRFLLEAGEKPRAGFCAEAVYRYVINPASTTGQAWADPLKYTAPFEQLYPFWLATALQKFGSLPIWLQNCMLYDLFWYVDADRQVFHASRQISPEVLGRCASFIRQMAGFLDYETVLSYALTPVGLDRRMLLAACTSNAPSAPLNGQVISYARKPWQVARKYTYFYAGDLPRETVQLAGSPVEPVAQRWVSHTLFGVEMVRERILWFAGENLDFALDSQPVKVAPYAGNPKLPAPASTIADVPLPWAGKKVEAPRTGLLERTRKKLWRLRKRVSSAAPAKQVEGADKEETRQGPKASPRVWFYMDRAHRAGDNAEALYRYASKRVPGVEHVFALSPSSSDWERLALAGFTLVVAGSADFERLLAEAENVLVSDISDPVLAPALAGLGADQRLVFLQHGIIRKQMWRWLNSRRIDVLVTSADDETARIVADGSSYTLSAPQVWQAGMPRLDRLALLRNEEKRRDVLLIAPSWVPSLRSGADKSAVQAWVDSWTSWIPAEYLGEISPVTPVFFVHPNMEQAVAGVEWQVQPVFGADLPEFLARAIVTVTDRSSVADEGHCIGIPAFLLLADDAVDAEGLKSGYALPGFSLVPNFDVLVQRVEPFLKDSRWSAPLTVGADQRYPRCEALVQGLLG